MASRQERLLKYYKNILRKFQFHKLLNFSTNSANLGMKNELNRRRMTLSKIINDIVSVFEQRHPKAAFPEC